MGEGRDDGDPGGSQPTETVAVSGLDELEPSPRRHRGRIAVTLIALVGVVAVVGAIVATAPESDDDRKADLKPDRVETPAARQVLAALGTTTASGSYNATYEFHSTPGAETPVPNSECGPVKEAPDGSSSQSCVAYAPRQEVTITGRSTINIDPYRMVSVSEVTGFGEITVQVDGTQLWETGGGNYTGPISGFADLVMGTLGRGSGALTMLSIASPNGYLSLQKESVSGVTPAGTGVVEGVPVTYYEVVVDPARLLAVPGLTGEQSKTIGEALVQLREAGYLGTTTKVGIDAAGLIRETRSFAKFDDGSRQTNHTTFSNFGCAGIVHLPGDPPSTEAPQPCVSTAAPPPPPPSTTVPPTTVPAPTVPPTTATPSTRTATTPPVTTSDGHSVAEVDQYGQPVAPPGWTMPTVDGKPACDRYGPACPGP